MIKVVNIRKYDPRPGELAIPIHRPYPLGNPFPLVDVDNLVQREECIEKYENWFYSQIANKDPLIMGAIDFIKANMSIYTIVLCCFCAPKRCHGEVIKSYLERTEV